MLPKNSRCRRSMATHSRRHRTRSSKPSRTKRARTGGYGRKQVSRRGRNFPAKTWNSTKGSACWRIVPRSPSPSKGRERLPGGRSITAPTRTSSPSPREATPEPTKSLSSHRHLLQPLLGKRQAAPAPQVVARRPMFSPFEGNVELVEVNVKVGDTVTQGQVVAAVEAMKPTRR